MFPLAHGPHPGHIGRQFYTPLPLLSLMKLILPAPRRFAFGALNYFTFLAV
jgi:hypothetical protein